MVFPPDAGVRPLPDLPDTGVELLGPVLPDDDVGVELLAWPVDVDRPVLAFRETGVKLLGVVLPLGGVAPLGGVRPPLGGVLPRASDDAGLCFAVSASGLVSLVALCLAGPREVADWAWWWWW